MSLGAYPAPSLQLILLLLLFPFPRISQGAETPCAMPLTSGFPETAIRVNGLSVFDTFVTFNTTPPQGLWAAGARGFL